MYSWEFLYFLSLPHQTLWTWSGLKTCTGTWWASMTSWSSRRTPPATCSSSSSTSAASGWWVFDSVSVGRQSPLEADVGPFFPLNILVLVQVGVLNTILKMLLISLTSSSSLFLLPRPSLKLSWITSGRSSRAPPSRLWPARRPQATWAASWLGPSSSPYRESQSAILSGNHIAADVLSARMLTLGSGFLMFLSHDYELLSTHEHICYLYIDQFQTDRYFLNPFWRFHEGNRQYH